MSTTTQAKETLYYRFDLRRLPLDPLERFQPMSEFQMEADPARYLARYGCELDESKGDTLCYYRSPDSADSAYMAFVELNDGSVRYRLIFHIHDDVARTEWRRRFEPYLHRILGMPGILPEPPQDSFKDHVVAHLDSRMVRANAGFY